nr:MAB_1171c family putative transporter [Kibdelosporangium sp. MJ126-NF4]CEL19364.1 putative integral membrane protein [Kibdelosporangium sp. MJ126-NF4]CTQ94837.1 putative integral membrane protein [Kibdelosporangium sp. MJ126-NF4]
MSLALVVQYLAIAALTAVCVFWGRSWWRRRQPNALALFLCLVSLEVAFVITANYYWFTTLIRVPALTQVIMHTAVLSCVFWLQVFTLYLGSSPETVNRKSRVRLVILTACLLALYVLYLLGPLPQGLPAINGSYGDRPYVLSYLSVFSLSLAWAIGDIAWATRFARHVPDRYLRLGLHFIRYGSVFGLVFALHKFAQTLAKALGTPLPWLEYSEWTGVSTYLLSIGTFLCLTGFMLPSLGPRWERGRTLRRLEPLWRALTEQAPELVFSTNTKDTADRLRNRITEIRDVLVGPLQPYLHPTVADRATELAIAEGLEGEQLQATVEAATVAVGLEARKHDIPAPITAAIVFNGPDAADHGVEAAWLAKVSTAFTGSGVVRTVVREFTEQEIDRAHN